MERAVAAGTHKVSIPVSASETHSKANVRKNHAEMLEEVRRINEMLDELPEERRPIFEAGIATAFGCTMEGAGARKQGAGTGPCAGRGGLP